MLREARKQTGIMLDAKTGVMLPRARSQLLYFKGLGCVFGIVRVTSTPLGMPDNGNSVRDCRSVLLGRFVAGTSICAGWRRSFQKLLRFLP